MNDYKKIIKYKIKETINLKVRNESSKFYK